jgi:hypothetical protein
MLLPILSLALAAPAPEPPPQPPKGPAPRVMVLNVDKDGKPYFEAVVRVATTVPQQRTSVVLVGGQQQVRTVTVQVPVTTLEQRRISLTDEGVSVYSPDGKKLDPKDLPKQTGPAPVLVSADGKEVDPFYLGLVKQGTLIVVGPALHSAQPSDESNAPPGAAGPAPGPGFTGQPPPRPSGTAPPPGATTPKP